MLKRLPIELKPDMRRVVCLPFNTENKQCTERICNDILTLDSETIDSTFDALMNEFSFRHKGFTEILKGAFSRIKKHIPHDLSLSIKQQLLIASYFVKEYSLEGAALFNPSIVVHPQQDRNDELKILISLRATGEGHISSIEFIEGYIDSNNNMTLSERKPGCRLPKLKSADIEKSVMQFDDDVLLNEQVIYPLTADESNGIEDVRFVQFADENGKKSYYGTFTAFDCINIKSKLICTDDFKKYTIRSLKGQAVNDKGMALFPRKINNRYAMISRQDGENIRIMFSDDLLTWESSQILQAPEFPWQFGKLGNCGSPIELDEGWLLLAHGVGPLRKYVMGAYLLDKTDPTKVLKRTRQPMLQAKGKEREGYVPNVVYSCGGICHNDTVFIPFALSDFVSSVVSVPVNDLLGMMD